MNKETPEKLQDEILYFLDLPLDVIVIGHFYSVTTGFLGIFLHFSDFFKCIDYIEHFK